MEVEFTYKVTGRDRWDLLEAACERAVKLNPNFTSFAVLPPEEGEDAGLVLLRSAGHDRSAITRRIMAPIRSVFHRAGITTARINLIEQRVMPTKRNLKLDEGRTPPGTFADSSLREMLKEHATVDERPSGDA